MEYSLHEEFCLTNETGKYLYHRYAEKVPIIDYHCHLDPREIAEDREFEDLGEMWLSGDHYKWRVMRLFGVDEYYITGKADYHEKYLAFASLLPKLIGNPIYIWCALELKRYFGINEPVSLNNAEEIYRKTKTLIQEKHMTRRWCLEKSNVRLISTTEDPIDDLRWHRQIAEEGFPIRVITAFRPDRAMFIEHRDFGAYIHQLSESAELPIESYKDMVKALERRLCYFKEVTGTTVSDNGVPHFTWVDYSEDQIEVIFRKALRSEPLDAMDVDRYQSAFLMDLARLYRKYHYVMQLHIGTYLDANTRGVERAGQSTGFDCTDDNCQATSVGELLNRLTMEGNLPKLILYPLDGTKIETWAVLAAGFSTDGIGKGEKGKVQLGAPWWFNDQPYGIRRHLEACANLYPISLSVGMLTDSRSFLSYPRHELYRRILCDYFGTLIERGEYFSPEEELGQIIRDICFNNANSFFSFGIDTVIN